MNNFKFVKLLLFTLVILLAISQEAECRRQILKGRKAITRKYYRYSAIPAWAVVVIVGVAELLFGAILFVILKLIVLDQVIKPRYIREALVPQRSSP